MRSRATLRLDGKKYQVEIEQYPLTDGTDEMMLYKVRYDGVTFVGDTHNEAVEALIRYIRRN